MVGLNSTQIISRLQDSRTLFIIRLGSTTNNQTVIQTRAIKRRTNKKLLSFDDVTIKEINTVQGVRNSSDKLLMKKAFSSAKVKTADWWTIKNGRYCFEDNENAITPIENLPFPLVLKSRMGSRGRGNTLINNLDELNGQLKNKNVNNYIIEKFYNYNKEYRLHVNEDGCFYTCRKMLKNETQDDKRWFRNDSNSIWIVEENEQFQKPSSFNEIVKDCQKSLKSLGLDFAAFDVRVQSEKDKKGNQRSFVDYIIIESNSAPSFGERTTVEYETMLNRLMKKRLNVS